MRTVYSTNTPVRELLQNQRAKAALSRMMPQIVQLPPSMGQFSIRTLATRMGGKVSAEVLNKLDAMLKHI